MAFPKFRALIDRLAALPFPGGGGATVRRFLVTFRESLSQGEVRTRSSAIAFQVLLAAPPGFFFLFSLLPYIPVANLEEEFLAFAGRLVPAETFRAVEPFLQSLFQGRGAAPFFGLAISLFIASNALDNIVDAFHATSQEVESRPFLHRRLVSLLLVILIALLSAVAAVVYVLGRLLSRELYAALYDGGTLSPRFLEVGSWLALLLLVYFAISLIYYWAPATHPRWRTVSAGSVTATIFVLLASWGFSLFLREVAQFDRLFGSLGTLMAIMIWLKLLALGILGGFELNVTIENSRLKEE